MSFNSFCILVTGTSGYLGANIEAYLRIQGAEIIGIPGRNGFENKLASVSPLRKINSIIHAGFDVDFSNLSSEPISSDNLANTRLITNFATSRGIPHIIFLSAAGVMGVSSTPVSRNEAQFGGSDYGYEGFIKTKYIQEKIACEKILEAHPLVTTLYLTTVYGLGMRCETRAALTKALRSRVIVAPPGGTSFLYLKDFLDVIEKIINLSLRGNFILSSGNTTYTELYQALLSCFPEKKTPIIRLPRLARYAVKLAAQQFGGKKISASVVESAFGYKYYSSKKLGTILDWSPQGNLKDAIRDAVS